MTSRLWQAGLAFYATMTGGILLTGVVSVKVAGVMTLVSAGLQAATLAYYKAPPLPEPPV